MIKPYTRSLIMFSGDGKVKAFLVARFIDRPYADLDESVCNADIRVTPSICCRISIAHAAALTPGQLKAN